MGRAHDLRDPFDDLLGLGRLERPGRLAALVDQAHKF